MAPKPITLEKAIQLKRKEKPDASPATYNNMRDALNRVLRIYGVRGFEQMPAGWSEDVEAFKKLAAEKYKPSSIKATLLQVATTLRLFKYPRKTQKQWYEAYFAMKNEEDSKEAENKKTETQQDHRIVTGKV